MRKASQVVYMTTSDKRAIKADTTPEADFIILDHFEHLEPIIDFKVNPATEFAQFSFYHPYTMSHPDWMYITEDGVTPVLDFVHDAKDGDVITLDEGHMVTTEVDFSLFNDENYQYMMLLYDDLTDGGDFH